MDGRTMKSSTVPGGEKLERWGNYLLVRPDPQVIWDTDQRDTAAGNR